MLVLVGAAAAAAAAADVAAFMQLACEDKEGAREKNVGLSC